MMTSLIELTNSISVRWVSWVLASLIETSALLVLAGVLWFAVRRQVSPQVWYLLFLLVPLKLLLPISITIPPAIAKWIPSVAVASWFERENEVANIESRPASATRDAVVSLHDPSHSDFDPVVVEMHPKQVSAAPDESGQPMRSSSQPTIKAEVEIPATTTVPRLSVPAILMIVWILGAATLLGRLVQTELRFRKRLNQLEAIEDSRLGLDLTELGHRAGVTRDVRVVFSDAISVPAVWGIFRPTIILPRAISSTLSLQQLQWVLLHELAHIRRNDLLVVACQRLVAVLHFYNPAVWAANRMIHQLREYACDDLAISLSDGSAADSGEAFLQILRQASHQDFPLKGALGVFGLDSRASCFERVRRMLDTERSIHIGLDRRSLCGLFLLALIALPRIYAAHDVTEPKPQQEAKEVAAPRADDTKLANPDAPPAEAKVALARRVGEFELRIVGPEGKPIPEALAVFRSDPVLTAEQIKQGKLARTGDRQAFITANLEGRIVTTISPNPGGLDVRIVTPGYGPYRTAWSSKSDSEQIPAKFTAELDVGWSVGGTIVDREGSSIQGAKISSRSSFTTRPGITSRTLIGTIAITDAAGKWRFESVEAGIGTSVEIDHPEFMPVSERINRRDYRTLNGQELVEMKIVLDPGLTVIGKVTDDLGVPVTGARVFGKVAS